MKRQFSRYLYREHMIGAYYQDEMIGFIMLGNAGTFGMTGQIISSIKHRDKATNNALIAKAVEVCAQGGLDASGLPVLERRLAQRVQAALRVREDRRAALLRAADGQRESSALQTGAHRGWRAMLPKPIKRSLKHASKRLEYAAGTRSERSWALELRSRVDRAAHWRQR